MCVHRCARILSNEIDAEPSDNGVGVVFVQTIKGEAVVEQSRGLTEHLTSHLEVHLGACLGYCLRGGPGMDLYAPGLNPIAVRTRIGLVFQKPNPFPKSIFDNVAYGPRTVGFHSDIHDIVERALRRAAPRCGTRSRTTCPRTRWRCRAASSSDL